MSTDIQAACRVRKVLHHRSLNQKWCGKGDAYSDLPIVTCKLCVTASHAQHSLCKQQLNSHQIVHLTRTILNPKPKGITRESVLQTTQQTPPSSPPHLTHTTHNYDAAVLCW
jgi:hypothetical protein